MEYDFSKLTDVDFEEFARDFLKRHLKVPHIEGFKAGRDKGIDLRYASISGKTIVQCKHYLKTGLPQLKRVLKNEELPKVKKLSPDRYILFTSVEMNPMDKDEILTAFSPFIKTTEDIISMNDIQGLLRDYDDVVKKNPKLWLASATVLKEILFAQFNNASISKTEGLIRKIQEKLPKYVQTKSYYTALGLLNENKSIIISGNAGIGKTTLAEMMICFLMKDGFTPVEITKDVDEARDLLEKDVKQVFYYDDFLGRTFVNCLNKNEDDNIVKFIGLVKNSKNKFFILTTREHMLSRVYRTSEVFKSNDILDNKYILNLDDYSKTEKARILYNHLYFSEISKDYLQNLLETKNYMKIIEHRNYNPRIIERMSNTKNIKNIQHQDYTTVFIRNLDNPEEILKDAFNNQLSVAAKNLLVSMYLDENLYVGTPNSQLEVTFYKYHLPYCKKYNLSASASDFQTAVKELEDSFIKIRSGYRYKELCVDYFDPSVKDFMEYYLRSDDYNIEDLIVCVETFPHLSNIAGLLFILSTKHLIKKDMQLLESRLKVIYEEKKNEFVSKKYNDFVNVLITTIKINSYINSNNISALIKEGLQLLSEKPQIILSWSFDGLISAITSATNIDAANKSSLLKTLNYAIIKHLPSDNEAHDLADFKMLHKIGLSYPQFFSTEDYELIKTEMSIYLKEDVLTNCENECSSGSEVGEFFENVRDIADTFSVDYEQFISQDAFNEIQADKEAKEQERDYDIDDDYSAHSVNNDNADIDNMFSMLLSK